MVVKTVVKSSNQQEIEFMGDMLGTDSEKRCILNLLFVCRAIVFRVIYYIHAYIN